MSYTLHSLTVRNFVVFVDEFTISFSGTDINHIEAEQKQNPSQSNGAGKSSLLDAICLALFGKGLRFNHLADYIAPTNPDGGVYISLDLIDESSNILKIERWRRPKSASNKAKVWMNGKLLTKDSTVSKVDELLSEYIGVSHSNFLSCIFSVMLPGFLSMRPAQRFEILENALAVKKLDIILKKLNTQLKSAEDRLSETNYVLTEKRQLLGQELARRDVFSQNKEKLLSAIESQKVELADLYSQETALNSKKESLLKLRLEASEKLTKVNNNLSTLQASKSVLVESVKRKQIESNSVKANLTVVDSSTIECKVCKSSLDKFAKQALLNQYIDELSELESQFNDLNSKITATQSQSNTVSDTLSKVNSLISNIDNELSLNRSSSMACEKTIRITKDSLKTAEESFDSTLLTLLNSDVTNLVDQRNKLQDDVKIISAWKHAMSKNGLRLAYLREEVGLLSAITSKFTSSVYARPMSVKFFISEDKDTPTIDFTVNDKNANAFSTGERRLLEIAITLSLMTLLKSNGMTIQTLILDESMDGLSVASKKAVVDVIKQLSADNQIVSISHDPVIKSLPGNVIKVVKDITTETSIIEQYQR